MKRISLMKILFLILLSGVFGLLIALSFFALFIEPNQPIREWGVTFFWALLFYLISAPLIYLPSMFLLHKLLQGYRPAILFPALAAFIGLVPVLLFISAWGGRVQNVGEWLPFYAVYVPVGILFGVGYVRLHRKEAV